MMREEGMAEEGTNQPTGKFWGMVGGLSGGALGFIVANVPGLVAGAVAGNRLGAIRDAKGKSVYSVFQVRLKPHTYHIGPSTNCHCRSSQPMTRRGFLASWRQRFLAMPLAHSLALFNSSCIFHRVNGVRI
jgi:hypothetical protein